MQFARNFIIYKDGLERKGDKEVLGEDAYAKRGIDS